MRTNNHLTVLTLTLGVALGACADETGTEVSPEVQAAADAAFEYGYPLTEMMRVCDTLPVVNKAFSQTKLSTPEEKTIVLPNNDTLYTVSCFYLADSWVKLSMPEHGSRYTSAEIFDAYTNEVGLASGRDIPEAGQEYVLHLTGTSTDDLPDGLPVIEVPTPYAYMLARVLVDGPDDLEAAGAVQQQIVVTPNSNAQPDRKLDLESSTDAQAFFLKVNRRLQQNPPPDSEAKLLKTFELAGVHASATPEQSDADAEQLAAWEIAYAKGFDQLEAAAKKLNKTRGQWAFPSPDAAQPGTNYELRAAIARFGIFPLPPTESLYPRTNGDGNEPQVLHLPNSWPPVSAPGFWSLTMYADGYLVDNAIDRYSIGDRTPGVKKDSDGSLKIYIQCKDPGGDLTANWLPAPCGPYSMTMRLYLPTGEAQDPTFTLPALE